MTTKAYDPERFLYDLVDILKTNLGAKITEINTCKNDNVVLTDIPSARYLDSLSEEALNFDKFIYFGIRNIAVEGSVRTALAVNAFFDIVFVDPQSGNSSESNMLRTSLRYTKAVKEVLEENYSKIKYASNLEIKELAPINLTSLEEENSDIVKMKVGGVRVVGNIA